MEQGPEVEGAEEWVLLVYRNLLHLRNHFSLTVMGALLEAEGLKSMFPTET
jgi:hypothetical protein